jgi:hypothetical protein
MTRRHDFDDQLRAWAELGDERLPADHLNAALAQIERTPQRRSLAGWRFPRMNRFAPLALAATALVVVLLVGIGLILGSPEVGPSPTPGPTNTATQEPSATAEPSQRAAAWSATASMSDARTGHTATRLADGTVLVAGGRGCCADEQGDESLLSAELYDPASGTWTATGNMTQARTDHTATLLLDGRVLVTGGHSDYRGVPDRDRSAELYDPATGTWTATGAMSLPHYGGTATLLLDGTVLLAGGDSREGNSSGEGNSAELYHPASGSWSDAGGMIEKRVHHAATLLSDGKVLLVGGYGWPSFDTPDRLASAELYDPGTGTWIAARSMNEPRAWITAVLLRDGRVLVAGGEVHIASAELYDPASGTWTPTGNSDIRGTLGTYTLLGDGRVLAVGNCCDTAESLATAAELFNPVDGTWTATTSMDEAKFGHTATLLTDGTVLVAGGFVQDTSGNETMFASAEVYDPGSES